MKHSHHHVEMSLWRYGALVAVGVSAMVAGATALFDYFIYYQLQLSVWQHVLFNALVALVGIAVFALLFIRRVRRIHRHHAEQLRQLAETDGLTGLSNHRHLQLELEKEWARMERHGHPLACVLLDLDNFKQVNDTRGHLAGDEILRRVAQILSDDMREVDVVARYGGEEFVLILSEKPAHRGGLMKTMERVRQLIEQEEFRYRDLTLRVTASLGGAIAPCESIPSPDRLVRAADKAMYAAKRAGKNCCKLWDSATMR